LKLVSELLSLWKTRPTISTVHALLLVTSPQQQFPFAAVTSRYVDNTVTPSPPGFDTPGPALTSRGLDPPQVEGGTINPSQNGPISQIELYAEISSSYGDEYEGGSLLGCYAHVGW
jgi:hypothetical protein